MTATRYRVELLTETGDVGRLSLRWRLLRRAPRCVVESRRIGTIEWTRAGWIGRAPSGAVLEPQPSAVLAGVALARRAAERRGLWVDVQRFNHKEIS